MAIGGKRTCGTCSRELPLWGFRWDRIASAYLNTCTECWTAQRQAHRRAQQRDSEERNRERRLAQKRATWDQNRDAYNQRRRAKYQAKRQPSLDDSATLHSFK